MTAEIIISLCPNPKTANKATKAKMVSGLVSAKRKAETYDPSNLFSSKGMIGSLRLARNVLIPRNKSNPPPARLSQTALCGNDIRNKRETERSETSIQRICGCSSKADYHSACVPFSQCLADAHYSHRSNRYRNGKSNNQSF